MVGGVHGKGVCVARGHVLGCMVGRDVHGSGHVWQGGGRGVSFNQIKETCMGKHNLLQISTTSRNQKYVSKCFQWKKDFTF